MISVSQALILAWQHYEAGRWPQAEQLFQQVLEVDDNQPEALRLLGAIAAQTGRDTLAIYYLRAALRLRPQCVELHNTLGIVLMRQGNLPEALAGYQEALRLQPDYVEAHNNLGVLLREQGKLVEAVASLEHTLRLRPDYADGHSNLGLALQDQGKLDEAVAHFEEAQRLAPEDAEIHNNLGLALEEQGRLTEAVVCLQQAVSLSPNYADAHNNLGMLWLLQGNFEQGAREYEWRIHTKDYPFYPRSQPRWDGGPVRGKTILLHAEQGKGDTFQFIRYAAEVKRRGATVVMECSPDLQGVLAGCPGIDRLLPQEESVPACDVHAPLLSLPGLCGTTLATIPAEVPYLLADRARVAHWQARLAGVSGYKVGICWQGNPAHKKDRQRSLPLSRFAPLGEVPGIRLVSLQQGPGQEQWAERPGSWPVVELSPQTPEVARNWVETAALIAALDLVITVDTAVAHLAGALAVQVWLALPFSPDWRWLLGRADSPWYPTMRLFRQERPGDWADVFERMAGELGRRVT